MAKSPISIASDIEAVKKINIVPQLLDVICRTTGMRFAAIARVTEDRWVTCSSLDQIAFGLKPGDELEVETTICHEIRQSEKAVIIESVDDDAVYSGHPTPEMYHFKSYISVPIFKTDGSFFGTLCAIDPDPAEINTPEITGMFELFANLISFHLNTEEQLNIKNKQLNRERQSAKLRERFIGVLGHDLKNPVGTIRMSSDILRHMNLEDKASRQADLIKSTTYRMEGLIDNVLDFARGRFGEGITLDKHKSKTALANSLKQVIKEIKTMSPEHKIAAEIELNRAVNSDENRIAQLFSNLMGNAVHHGEKGSPIKVRVSTENDEFLLSVTNKGEKIPELEMKNLFKPFTGDEKHQRKKGLGLGLYICSEIAKAHGGKINVESTKEETSFSFRMPLDS